MFDLPQNREDASGVKPSRSSYMIGGWCVIFIVRARKEGIRKREWGKKNGSDKKGQNYWCYCSWWDQICSEIVTREISQFLQYVIHEPIKELGDNWKRQTEHLEHYDESRKLCSLKKKSTKSANACKLRRGKKNCSRENCVTVYFRIFLRDVVRGYSNFTLFASTISVGRQS